MFHGTITALVTPFRDGVIDEEAFAAHLERQIEAGVDGVVPAGTTGEAATLSVAEHKRLIELTVRHVRGRVAVIAGTGSNNTAESIELTRAAKEAGADAALLISPYYNKPTQEGIFLHYEAVARAVHLPQIIYNVPGRTASTIQPETIGRLARIANIVGVKDATADMDMLASAMDAADGGLDFLSGDDASVTPFMAMGGKGVISVVSNIAPKTMKALTDAMLAGDLAAARARQMRLIALNRAMFIESNPIPVKAACAMLGWMRDEPRLPLTPLSPPNRALLAQAMRDFHGDDRLELAAD